LVIDWDTYLSGKQIKVEITSGEIVPLNSYNYFVRAKAARVKKKKKIVKPRI